MGKGEVVSSRLTDVLLRSCTHSRPVLHEVTWERGRVCHKYPAKYLGLHLSRVRTWYPQDCSRPRTCCLEGSLESTSSTRSPEGLKLSSELGVALVFRAIGLLFAYERIANMVHVWIGV